MEQRLDDTSTSDTNNKKCSPETELERLLKHSDVMMSVDKLLDMAKTMTTISVYLPRNKTHLIKTMPMKRHKPMAKLFEPEFWEAQ